MKTITRRDFLRTASACTAIASAGGLAVSTPGRLSAQSADFAVHSASLNRKSFCFLHSYEATGRYWRGLEKAGLLRPSNGLRLVNSPYGDDGRRFNAVARIGGPLHQILKRRQCHFIVDRVVGGCFYHPYAFNAQLIEHYASMLGDKFLGGQVHETVCNVRNDWGRFARADKRFARQPIDPEKLRAWFNSSNEMGGLEYGTLDDYAGRVRPTSPQSLWREIERTGEDPNVAVPRAVLLLRGERLRLLRRGRSRVRPQRTWRTRFAYLLRVRRGILPGRNRR